MWQLNLSMFFSDQMMTKKLQKKNNHACFYFLFIFSQALSRAAMWMSFYSHAADYSGYTPLVSRGLNITYSFKSYTHAFLI